MSKMANQPLIGPGGYFHTATSTDHARVMVIAEIGVNHDGQVDRAVELIKAAAEAGANAVKFQYFHPDRLLSNQALLAEYQQGKAADPYALLDQLKLSIEDLKTLRETAKQCNVLFIVTPFSLEDVDELAELDIDAVKIASPDAVNTPLLIRAASLAKPLLVSTGTSEIEELEPAAALIRQHGAGGCLLHCVSSYPTPHEQAAIGAIRALMEHFGLPVGYSDHTPELEAGYLAVAAGACVVEKHLTYDCNADGPDHAASLPPQAFTWYTRGIHETERIIGVKAKARLSVEADVHNVSRQSVCVVRDMKAGDVLSEDDLTVKRPGGGIPAAELNNVIGKTLAKDVAANELLKQADVKPGHVS